MKKKIFFALLLLSSLQLIYNAIYAQSQELHIKVSNIRSAKGKIILNVFNNETGYEKQQPYKTFSFDKKAFANGTVNLKIGLNPGVYGVTLVDDENANGKMEKSFIGIPKEGFGFSNFFMTKMKKPAFDEFKFELKPGTGEIEIKAKYM